MYILQQSLSTLFDPPSLDYPVFFVIIINENKEFVNHRGVRGPQSWFHWDWNPRHTDILRTNFDENHIKISKNWAKNYQKRVFDKVTDRQTKTCCDRHKIFLTNTDGLRKNTQSGTDTDCLLHTNTVCERHTFSDRQRFSVTDNNCLW